MLGYNIFIVHDYEMNREGVCFVCLAIRRSCSIENVEEP